MLLKLKTRSPRLVAALEELSVGPEAEEHDLEAAEWNCNLEMWRRLHRESRLPEPGPQPTMQDLVAQARQLLTREEA